MARKLRRVLPAVLPVLGIAVVLAAVLIDGSVGVKVLLVALGLLLTEAGVWRLADPILPDDRKYMALRSEADRFMALVRQLNTAAIALDEGDEEGPRFALAELEREMRQSVDRMVEVAGRARDDGPAAPGGRPPGSAPGPAAGGGARSGTGT